MQEGCKLVASEPLIIRRETWWSPVRFDVADVPVIVLRRNVGGLEHVAHVRVPANLTRFFKDDVLHVVLNPRTLKDRFWPGAGTRS